MADNIWTHEAAFDTEEMPQFYEADHNPETALATSAESRRAAAKRSFSQIAQDFLHALRWSQLRRRLSPAGLWDLSKRYGWKLTVYAGLGYLAYNPNTLTDYVSVRATTSNMQASIAMPPSMEATRSAAPVVDSLSSATAAHEAIWQHLQQIDARQQRAYIKRFDRVAREEMDKFHIPASVMLGLAIMHSEYGTLPLADESNNHFNMDCSENTMDSHLAGRTQLDETCFVVYQNAWASFRAQSQLLAAAPYADLPETARHDYKLWALGLERLGYRKAPFSADLLVAIIEAHDLQKLDN